MNAPSAVAAASIALATGAAGDHAAAQLQLQHLLLGRSQVERWIEEEPDTRLLHTRSGAAYYNFLRDSTVLFRSLPCPIAESMPFASDTCRVLFLTSSLVVLSLRSYFCCCSA